ncbi:MAG: hypothetical protein HQ509_04855 [Candidatus Marinimicrobia bacterium]|nr:hypothetical protein [Candidatus Neomarinimicrobiota bacterium]
MKRPSMYGKHESSLKIFSDLFNSTKDRLPLVMQIYQTENFRDDGVIVNTKSGKRVTFDWEIRDKYFENGTFKFDTLGQFERKIKKDEIGLSLQCDKTETAIMVAWHEDWMNEKAQKISLSTDTRFREKGTIRYTKNFMIYPYIDMGNFRSMIYKAIESETFNHEVFA